MAVYPVGTPATFELPGAQPIGTWKFPDDFTLAGNTRSHPVPKPPGITRAWHCLYDIAYSSGGSGNPLGGFFECNADASQIASSGPSLSYSNDGIVPATAISAATPYSAWGAGGVNGATFYVFSHPEFPYLCAVNLRNAGDSGQVAIMSATTANTSTEPFTWNGPFQIDCGSGPNRLLLFELWAYQASNSASSRSTTVNGQPFTRTFGGTTLQPPGWPVSYKHLFVSKSYLLNPPNGVASLLFAWQGPARGIVHCSAYAGVDQTTPILQNYQIAPLPATSSTVYSITSQTGSTPVNVPPEAYWLSDFTCYSTPNATPGRPDLQIANLSTAGLLTTALQRGQGAGAPVTTTWTLDSSQMGTIGLVVLGWDHSSVPVVSGQNQVSIVG